MKVAIIGGTGFVGSYISEKLVSAGHELRLLVRPESRRKADPSATIVEGDASDLEAIRELLRGADALIYLIGILREFPKRGITFNDAQLNGFKNCLAIAKECQVRRVILMSANGVHKSGLPYQDTKFEAEQLLRKTDFDWTIFQPSVIFGDPRGRMEFCTQLKRDLVDPPIPASVFFPGLNIWQAGKQPMSPVHVEDVAAAFVNSLTRPETLGKSYVLAGPKTLHWSEIIQTIAKSVGKSSKWLLPVPAWLVQTVAIPFERFAWFPLTSDQVAMLMQGNAGNSEAVFELLKIEPTSFSESALEYLNRP